MKVKRFTKDKESIGFLGSFAIIRMNDWIGSMSPKGISLCTILGTVDKTKSFELAIFNNQKDVEAFIPRYEKYIRSKDKVIINPMFPGHLFIKTSKDQIEFDTMLTLMYEQKDGVIKELKKDEVSALTKDEIHLLKLLLNEQYILKMSKGYKQTNKTIVVEGPLKALQEHIFSVNKSI